MKVQRLVDDLEKLAWLPAQVTAKDLELTATRVASPRSTRALDAMTRVDELLQAELDGIAFHRERKKGV